MVAKRKIEEKLKPTEVAHDSDELEHDLDFHNLEDELED